MKKNVAAQAIGAQMCSATDGSAFTGAVTVYVTGDAGTQAVGSVGAGAATHEGNGYHTYAPAQAETNYDLVAYTFIGTGAIPATIQVYTDYPQTGDSFARVGAPAGASVSADIAAAKVDTAAIKVKTDYLPSVVAGGAGGVFIAGTNAATTVTASFTTTFTGNLTGSVASVSGAVGSVAGAVGSVTGAVGSVTSGVTVTTNNDKTGYALSVAGIQAIWDALTSALTTVGSIGKALVTNLDAAVSSRLASASYTAPLDAAGTRTAVGLAAANMDTQLSAISAKTGLIPASPAAVSDIPTAAAITTAVWTTGLTESYAAKGAAFTGAQAFYEISSVLSEFSITSTTITSKKRDGITTATTATLDSATTPTSRARAT